MKPGMRTPLVRSYVQHITASPEAVFPLLCPVREGEWLEGWADRCEVLWSASGLAERGCVFRTVEPGGPETIWTVTEHDPDRGVVTFTRVTAGLAVSTLHVEVTPDGPGASAVALRYTVVPTSAAGVAYAEERYDRADLLDSIVWWERSMNHYLLTGRLLRRDERDVVSRTRKE
jgi:hypothetical protein